MTRTNVLRSALALAAATLMFGLLFGTTRVAAQPAGPCPVYWVNYNYVYPPALATIPVQLDCAGGPDITSETTDGHFTYPWNPALGPANSVTIFGVVFPIPCPNTPIPTPYGILNVEVRWDPSKCRLEIRLSY